MVADDEMPAGGAAEHSEGSAPDVRVVERLYAEFRDLALVRATAILGDRHLGEDAVNQAFVQLIGALLAGRSGGVDIDPRAAVLRSTRWAALTILRRRRSRQEAARRLGSLATPEDEDWVRAEARILCETMLADLPAHYRAVLHCRYVEQVSDSGGAVRLGISLKAYRRRLDRAVHAARRAVRPRLEVVLAGLRGRRRRAATSSRPVRRRLRPSLLPASHAVGWRVVLALGASAVVAVPSLPREAVQPLAYTVRFGAARAGAWAETPEDTLFRSATVAAGYVHNRVIVAVGRGRRCGCAVLLRSADGGATWEAAPGPAQGTRVVLPPAYPSDPRIFVYDGAPGEVVSDAFGEPFHALPVPSGLLALDPAFDSGHARVDIAAADGTLWSVDLRSGALLQARVGTGGFTAFATAAPVGVAALVAVTAQPAAVAWCTPELRCRTRPLDAGAEGGDVVVAPDGAGGATVLVAGHHRLQRLSGGGGTLAGVALPAPVMSVESVAVAAGATWLLAGTAAGARVAMLSGPSASWRLLPGNGSPASWSGALVALTPDRVLDLLQSGGLRCTTDGGRTWASRCVPEPSVAPACAPSTTGAGVASGACRGESAELATTQ